MVNCGHFINTYNERLVARTPGGEMGKMAAEGGGSLHTPSGWLKGIHINSNLTDMPWHAHLDET